MKKIYWYWVSNGKPYDQIRDNTAVMSIARVNDLEKHFDVNELVKGAAGS